MTTLRKLLLIMATVAATPSHGAEDAHPRILLQTSAGNITVELDRV
jgi:hypothetical protein